MEKLRGDDDGDDDDGGGRNGFGECIMVAVIIIRLCGDDGEGDEAVDGRL